MKSLQVIENKISSVKKYLKILERYTNYKKEEIESNIDLRGAVERYLYLVIQSTIDLAEAVISYKGLRKPTTLLEAFEILNEEKIIPEKHTKNLIKMVGFRNILSHEYETLDYDIVYDILQNGKKDIEIFLSTIEKKLKLL